MAAPPVHGVDTWSLGLNLLRSSKENVAIATSPATHNPWESSYSKLHAMGCWGLSREVGVGHLTQPSPSLAAARPSGLICIYIPVHTQNAHGYINIPVHIQIHNTHTPSYMSNVYSKDFTTHSSLTTTAL